MASSTRCERPPRLFFLGAGFSRPAGIPLASELLDLVLDEVGRFRGETHLHRVIPEYLRYVENTTGKRPDQIDIEEFVTFLDHRHAFGLLGSDTWSEEGNRDQFLLRWGIGRVLHLRTPDGTALPEIYLEFARRLRPRDVVVSFNYDLLLERALEAVRVPYRRFPTRLSDVNPTFGTGDTDAESAEVLLLKPHGSLDWVSRLPFERRLEYMRKLQGENGERFARERALLFGPNPCSATGLLVEGPIDEADPLGQIEVIDDVASYYETFSVAFEHPPLILAPSQAKQLCGGALRKLWYGLGGYGYGWGGFAIIGYSLPSADDYTRLVLHNAVNGYVFGRENADWRLGPMSPICVVDRRVPGEASEALRQTYRFLPDAHATFRLDGFDASTLRDVFSEEGHLGGYLGRSA